MNWEVPKTFQNRFFKIVNCPNIFSALKRQAKRDKFVSKQNQFIFKRMNLFCFVKVGKNVNDKNFNRERSGLNNYHFCGGQSEIDR